MLNVDYSELIKYSKEFEAKTKGSKDMLEELAKELAKYLLNSVTKKTPVGHYNDGRVGGNLRRGWSTHGIEVVKEGNTYVCEITNPVEYASYVEYGHRTASGSGWVEGRFMMTKAELEIGRKAPQIIEKKIKKWLEG